MGFSDVLVPGITDMLAIRNWPIWRLERERIICRLERDRNVKI